MPFPPTIMKAARWHRPASGKLCTAGLLLAAVAGLALAGGTGLPLPSALWPISPAAATELPADPDQAANMLLVEAIELVAAAEEEGDPAARLAVLQRAQDNLDRIVRDYAASHVAVQLVTGQTIGTFDPADLADEIADAEAEVTAQAADAERRLFCLIQPRACALFDDARGTATSMYSADHRAQALSAIVHLQVEAGLSAMARETLADALDAAKSVGGRSRALSAIAGAQAALGMWQDALATADSIAREELRAEALSSIVAAQAEAGLTDAARQTFADALTNVRSIYPLSVHSNALLEIGTALAEAGLMDEARQVLEQAVDVAGLISEDRQRYRMISDLARTWAELGQLEEALRAANAIPVHSKRSEALYHIALAQAAAGSMDEAQQTLSDAMDVAYAIASQPDGSRAVFIVALTQAELGLLDEALSTARAIIDDPYRAYALSDIASSMAEAGSMDEARAILTEAAAMARAITESRNRSAALSIIALAQAEAELLEEAQTTFSEALDATNAITGHWQYRGALLTIASNQIEAGLWNDARDTTGRFPADFHPFNILLAIARAQAEAAVAALGER